MSEETSGPHPVSEQPPTNAVMNQLNVKNLLYAAALALGGALGGGGVSVATGGGTSNTVAASTQEIKDELKDLKKSMGEVTKLLISMKAESAASTATDKRHDKVLDDHEARLRDLERN